MKERWSDWTKERLSSGATELKFAKGQSQKLEGLEK